MQRTTKIELYQELNTLLSKHYPLAYELSNMLDVYRVENFLDARSHSFIPDFYVEVKNLLIALKHEEKKENKQLLDGAAMRRIVEAESPLQILLYEPSNESTKLALASNQLSQETQLKLAYTLPAHEKTPEIVKLSGITNNKSLPSKNKDSESEDSSPIHTEIIDGILYVDGVEMTAQDFYEEYDEEYPIFRESYSEEAYEIFKNSVSTMPNDAFTHLCNKRELHFSDEQIKNHDVLKNLEPDDYLIRHDKKSNSYTISKLIAILDKGIYQLNDCFLLPNFVEIVLEIRKEGESRKLELDTTADIEYLPYTGELGYALLNSSNIDMLTEECTHLVKLLENLKHSDLTESVYDFTSLLDGISNLYDSVVAKNLFQTTNSEFLNLITNVLDMTPEQYELFHDELSKQYGESLAQEILAQIENHITNLG